MARTRSLSAMFEPFESPTLPPPTNGTMSSPNTEILFRSQPDEFDADVATIDGTLPDDLRGTLYRNGPGIFENGPDRYHAFDAHGMLGALRIDGGRARLRTRHVRTAMFEAERRAGRQLKRRIFTNKPARWSNLFDVAFGNPAAHDVYGWGGRVFASNDLGHYALDPITLETLGRHDLGGLARGKTVSCPMTRDDPTTGRLVGYCIRPGALSPDALTFAEFDADWKVVSRAAHRLSGPNAFVHDVAFTSSHYVLFEAPVRLRVARALWGARPAFEAFEWVKGRRARLHVVGRDGGNARTHVIDPPDSPTVVFHILNAHNQGDDLIIDAIGVDGPVSFSSLYPEDLRARDAIQMIPSPSARILRFTVNAQTGACTTRKLTDIYGDLPEVDARRHGQSYRWAFISLSDAESKTVDPNMFFFSPWIARIDVTNGNTERWSAGADSFCSQVAFAPRVGSDRECDGYALVWVTRAATQTTDLVVLDAGDFAKGPVCTLRLGVHLPLVSHTRFVPG